MRDIQRNVVAIPREGVVTDGGREPLGLVVRRVKLGLHHDNAELVAPGSSYHVNVANVLAQNVGDPQQPLVAGGMAIGVVDLFQAVHVEVDQTGWRAVALGDRDGAA